MMVDDQAQLEAIAPGSRAERGVFTCDRLLIARRCIPVSNSACVVAINTPAAVWTGPGDRHPARTPAAAG